MKNIVVKIILVLLIWVNITHSQIEITIPDTSIEATNSITIPIYISDVTDKGIYLYQFRLKYDKEVLKPKSIIDDGTISDKRSWDINAYLDNEGLVVRANGWYWLSGGGVLLYIKFDVLKSSGRSDLILDPFVFNNDSPKPQINNGSFRVFEKRTISFNAQGSGSGKISINEKEYNLPLEIKLEKDEFYSIKAIPNLNSFFKNWTGDLNSDKNPIIYEVTSKAEITVNFVIKSFSISAILEPRDYGFVEGVGVYNYGDEAILKANPYAGKKFVNWKLNGNILSTNMEYKFTVQNDLELKASFENSLFQITTNANPAEGGLVTGSGYYFPNDTVTIIASSNANWDFTNWSENGEIVSEDSIYSFIVTENRELMANYLSVTDIVSNSIISLKETFLSEPYPNPFNPSTTFEFALKSNSRISLAIIDITGKVVLQIYNNEILSQGIYSNVFNAANLASGVYFYRFEAEDSETKKTLLKGGKIVLVK